MNGLIKLIVIKLKLYWRKKRAYRKRDVETFKALIEILIDKNQTWVQGDCTLENRKTDISIWTANVHILDTCIYKPKLGKLSLRKRYLLWEAVKICRTNLLAKALKFEKNKG